MAGEGLGNGGVGKNLEGKAGEWLWLALVRHLRPRLVPGEEPPAAAVAERIVRMSAAELQELVQRLCERLAAEG